MHIFIKLIADGAVIPVILLGAYALAFKVPRTQRYQAYCRILMAGLTAYLLAKYAGAIYQPSGLRPFEVMGAHAGALYLNNPGFPSDHALFTAAITLAVWFETRQRAITLIMVALTASVCVGRVLALVHRPVDVLIGVLIACVGGLWYLQRGDKLAKFAKTS